MVERTNSHKLSSDLHVCTMEHTLVPHKNKHNNFFSLKRSVSKDICMLVAHPEGSEWAILWGQKLPVPGPQLFYEKPRVTLQ